MPLVPDPLVLPLPGLVKSARPYTRGDQLTLIGHPQPVRIPADLWRSWLADPGIVDRFEAKRYRRADDQCWPWTGAISSTAHGSFRAASLPGSSRRGVVPAHLFGWQLAHGVIPRLGWSGAEDPCLCHRCDEAACCNPAHLRLGTNAQNRAEWAARWRDPHSPLADLRGPAGRARAIAETIRAGLAEGLGADQIGARIAVAAAAGRPLTLW